MRATLIPWATGDQIAKLQALVYDIKVPGERKKAKLDEYKNYRYIFVFIIFGESYS